MEGLFLKCIIFLLKSILTKIAGNEKAKAFTLA